MEKRLYGQENELGMTVWNGKEWKAGSTIIYPRISVKLKEMGKISSGFQLNGGKIYEDRSHVEIASPEACSARDVILASRGCERLVEEIFSFEKRGIIFVKNNTDILADKHCFGMHENYLLDDPLGELWPRSRTTSHGFNENFLSNLIAFLISRIIFTGNGVTSVEENENKGKFYLSNRARFINRKISPLSTENNRSIVTTKCWDYTAIRRFKRLHLSCGDPNMSEFQDYLKFGVMGLILRAAEDNVLPNPALKVMDPVYVMQKINIDFTFREPCIVLKDKRQLTAIEVQRIFLENIKSHYPKKEDSYWVKQETIDILSKWAWILEQLEKDPLKTWRYLDWVIKKRIGDSFLDKKNLARKKLRYMGNSKELFQLRSLEENYHELHADGLYRKLCKQGKMFRILSDEEIEMAKYNPPGWNNPERRNRSWLRAQYLKLLFQRESDARVNVKWDVIYIGDAYISMEDPFKWQNQALAPYVVDPFESFC